MRFAYRCRTKQSRHGAVEAWLPRYPHPGTSEAAYVAVRKRVMVRSERAASRISRSTATGVGRAQVGGLLHFKPRIRCLCLCLGHADFASGSAANQLSRLTRAGHGGRSSGVKVFNRLGRNVAPPNQRCLISPPVRAARAGQPSSSAATLISRHPVGSIAASASRHLFGFPSGVCGSARPLHGSPRLQVSEAQIDGLANLCPQPQRTGIVVNAAVP